MALEDYKQQIGTARQNISLARQQVEEERRKAEAYEKEVSAIEVPRRSLEFQQQYIKTGAIPSGRVEQIMQERQEYKIRGASEAQRVKQELSKYETETIAPAEAQVGAAEQSVREYEEDVADYERAQRAVDIGNVFGLTNRQQKYYREILANEKAAKARIEARKPQLVFTDTLGQPMSIDPSKATGYYGYTTPTGVEFKPIAPVESKPFDFVFNKEVSVKPINVVEAYEPKGFEKIQYSLSKRESVLAGIGGSLIGTARFGYGLVTSPVETTKSTGTGLFNVGKRIYTGEGFPEIGETLRTRPKYSTGYVLGEVIQYKAPDLFLKGSDIWRTKLMKQLPDEVVVAPEYFKGQTYPQIAKGEKAGDLLGEFKPLLPGETKAAGFTASPKSFAKKTDILAGTSELPGLYQSPKLSPVFLRVTGEGEKKLFSFFNYGSWRPTIARVTPESFELVPQISYASKVNPVNLGKVRSFFYNTAEKGKSYIPFIKTEKEAVIPFGTKLFQTGKRYFIKFEGRRIPIFEYATSGASNIKNTKITSTVSLIDYSSRKVGKASYFSSYDVARISSYGYKGYDYGNSYLSGYYNPFKSSFKSIGEDSKLSGYVIYKPYNPKPYKPYESGSSGKINYRLFSGINRIKPYVYKPYTYIGYKNIFGTGKKKVRPKKIKLSGKGKKKAKFKQPIRYQPSLAASALKITSKKIPKTLGGKNTYFAGFRPIIK